LIPTPAEAAEQHLEETRQEHQRAERLAARLRELGVDPEKMD
jgi:ferritin-like protein